MRKPTILLDMDDVLADFIPEWLRRYNEDYGDSMTLKDVASWDLHTLVKPECGLAVYDYFRDPGLYRNLEPKPDSQEVVNDLVKLGAEIVIVTDSPMGCSHGMENWMGSNPADDKRAWLQEHFPMIPKDNVVITGKKWFVVGDILVDDKPDTIEIFQNMGRKIIAVDMPYNQQVEADLRAKNWKDIHRLILSEWFKGG